MSYNTCVPVVAQIIKESHLESGLCMDERIQNLIEGFVAVTVLANGSSHLPSWLRATQPPTPTPIFRVGRSKTILNGRK